MGGGGIRVRVRGARRCSGRSDAAAEVDDAKSFFRSNLGGREVWRAMQKKNETAKFFG